MTITSIRIRPEDNNPAGIEYEFSEHTLNGKNWFNVTMHHGSKSYVLGSVISGKGFVPCEGTVIRPLLMQALDWFNRKEFKVTATELPFTFIKHIKE